MPSTSRGTSFSALFADPGQHACDDPVAARGRKGEDIDCGPPGPPEEALAEERARTVQAGLDHLLADLEGLGDFLRRETLDLAQDEDHPVDRPQVAEGLLEEARQLMVARVGLGAATP